MVIVAVAILFTFLGLPFFSRYGYGLWAIVVYFFLFAIFMYGRRNRLPKRPISREPMRREQLR
jgi:hypothetical protein